MSIQADPKAIGGFVIGAVLILLAAIIFFGTGDFFNKTEKFVLYFEGSLQGLKIGAPVSIKGVQVGQVDAIVIDVQDNRSANVLTQVTIEIDMDSFQTLGNKKTIDIEQWVQDGLRAQLRLQSLLTGLLYIEMNFFPDSEVQLTHLHLTDLPELPTLSTGLQRLLTQIGDMDLENIVQETQSVVSGLNSLINNQATQQLTTRFNQTLSSVQNLADHMDTQISQLTAATMPLIERTDQLITNLQQTLPATIEETHKLVVSLQTTAHRLDRTVGNVDFLLSDDSPLLYSLRSSMEEVGDAAYQWRALGQLLDAHPEALLRGK